MECYLVLNNPVTEQFRLEKAGEYVGSITLAYPNKSTAIVLGLVSSCTLTKAQIKALVEHIKQTGRTELVFYRVKHGKEIEKRYQL